MKDLYKMGNSTEIFGLRNSKVFKENAENFENKFLVEIDTLVSRLMQLLMWNSMNVKRIEGMDVN